MVGGVFGFLPVLGFWMLPLGAALIALDLPFTRKRIEKWMETLQQKARLDLSSFTPLATT